MCVCFDDDDDDGDDDDDDSEEFPLAPPIHRSLGIDPNHSCPQTWSNLVFVMMMLTMIVMLKHISNPIDN